ncbi:MAG: DUF2130 domain-containing protein [Deltaproteobacteria bacterium]|nr:MAG: DUF2130 domain-containing protein [Deltaproteobacteria bacterium]TMQ16338.1 MAG: DUF2130 domain-containing protein [Deltaproteobacteria bacterium]
MAFAALKQQDACPWCGQRISHKQFVEIESRLRTEDKRRHEAAEAEVQARLAAERETLETRYRADRTSLELTLGKLKEQLEKAKDDQAEFDKRLREATEAAAQAERKRVEAEVVKKQQAERERERELIKADFDQKMLKQDAENQKAAQALRKQVAELQKKLEDQAARRPEVVDLDVFEELKAAYGEDRVLRLPRGDAGGDLLIEVRYKGTICGRIIVDSRNRGNWQTSYATKLRADMVEQRADHAILATLHFPRGAAELCRHDDVLLVHPARVVELVGILRQAMVRMHQTRLSSEQRDEKKLRLYDHITSEQFRRKLADTGKLAEQLLDVDVDEVKEHQRVWKVRGGLLKRLETVQSEVVGEINDIIDGRGDD